MFAFFIVREVRYVSDIIWGLEGIFFPVYGPVFYGDISSLVVDWQHVYVLNMLNFCLNCYTRICSTYLTCLYFFFFGMEKILITNISSTAIPTLCILIRFYFSLEFFQELSVINIYIFASSFLILFSVCAHWISTFIYTKFLYLSRSSVFFILVNLIVSLGLAPPWKLKQFLTQ